MTIQGSNKLSIIRYYVGLKSKIEKLKLMKVTQNIYEYIRRARQIYREKGAKFFLKAILFKLQSRKASRNQPVLEDWLAFYQIKNGAQYNLTQGKDTNQAPKVSILILTFNNLPVTQLCLFSIYANTTYSNFEIIVVDNASHDETPSWLTKFAQTHSNLKVILNDKNLGFAAGNNQAARESEGEYLIFLNNDTVVTKGWMERLLSYIREDPNVGLVGPVTNAIGNEARIPVTYSTPVEMEVFAENRASMMQGQSFEIRMLALYCVLTRKDHFTSLGWLDERFGVGMFEDDDLAVRYHQSNLKVICVEDVFIHHFQSMSFSKLKKEHYDKLFMENRKKYEDKWDRKWEPYHFRQELFQNRQQTK